MMSKISTLTNSICKKKRLRSEFDVNFARPFEHLVKIVWSSIVGKRREDYFWKSSISKLQILQILLRKRKDVISRDLSDIYLVMVMSTNFENLQYQNVKFRKKISRILLQKRIDVNLRDLSDI